MALCRGVIIVFVIEINDMITASHQCLIAGIVVYYEYCVI